MEFESPDVEKDFPGLYASETTKKGQTHDSDYSDEEKLSRKDLLGKRKDKKESKKDKGYVAFEGESSADDADETKSPSKSKKNKSAFKFSRQKNCSQEKKEKHSKLKEKEGKDKKDEKEKVCKKDGKECKKDKATKEGERETDKMKLRILKERKLLKIKDRKKKSLNQTVAEELPVFGVPLQIAVERSKSHDGIEIPVIVRECIDYIEEHGLACEGIYRISGVKSKLRQLKMQYNRGEKVYLYEHEPHIVASLLKQFLRDLPESILTSELLPKFEEAAALKDEQKKVETFEKLLAELPTCNRLLLSWIFIHMFHVISLEKRNKMNLQNVSIVLSPTMQISHRVLHVLFAHSGHLFRGYEIKKYVPPVELDSSRLSLELPDSPTAIEEELSRQENALNKLHAELNTGLRDMQKEEQLWEIQRVVTQLKRKFRFLRQVKNAANSSHEIPPVDSEVNEAKSFCLNSEITTTKESRLSPKSPAISEKANDVQVESEVLENVLQVELEVPENVLQVESEVPENVLRSESKTKKDCQETCKLEEETQEVEINHHVIEEEKEMQGSNEPDAVESEDVILSGSDVVDDLKEILSLMQNEALLRIQRDELMLLGDELRRKINSEKLEIDRLRLEINEYQQLYKYKQYSFDSTENSSSDSEDTSASEYDDDDEFTNVLLDLMKENKQLEEKNATISKEIQQEREISLNIKVQMKMVQTDAKNTLS